MVLNDGTGSRPCASQVAVALPSRTCTWDWTWAGDEMLRRGGQPDTRRVVAGVDEYVGEGHPVREIDAFVEMRSLGRLRSAGPEPKAAGRSITPLCGG